MDRQTDRETDGRTEFLSLDRNAAWLKRQKKCKKRLKRKKRDKIRIF